MLDPGIYVLTKTIANPKPDRRVKDRWLDAPCWEEGMRFEVLEEPDETRVRLQHICRWASLGAVLLYWEPKGVIGGSRDKRQDAAISELVAALEPARSLRDTYEFLFRTHWWTPSSHGDDVLWALIQRGKVSIGDVRAMTDEIHDDEQTLSAEAFNAKWGV